MNSCSRIPVQTDFNTRVSAGSRVRRQSQQRTVLLVSAVIFMLVLLIAHPGQATAQNTSPLESATSWLIAQRLDNGAFAGFEGAPDPGTTVDAVTALALAGELEEADKSTAYLETEALVYIQIGPGSAAKLALMLEAMGKDPHSFATVDPLSIVEHAALSGMIGFGPFDHALGLLALQGGGSEIPEVAIAALFDSQVEGAGWAFDGSTLAGAADTNTTALMLQAAHVIGIADDERIGAARTWLTGLQTSEGFPYQPEGPADSNSTAVSLQALTLYPDYDPTIELGALLLFQNESGSFSWLLDPRDENLFSTIQSIPALSVLQTDIETPIGSPEATPEASPAASPIAQRTAA